MDVDALVASRTPEWERREVEGDPADPRTVEAQRIVRSLEARMGAPDHDRATQIQLGKAFVFLVGVTSALLMGLTLHQLVQDVVADLAAAF